MGRFAILLTTPRNFDNGAKLFEPSGSLSLQTRAHPGRRPGIHSLDPRFRGDEGSGNSPTSQLFALPLTNSCRRRPRFAIFIISVILAGCVVLPPPDILKMPPDQLAKRQQQSRQYDTTDEEKILSACAGVLQDLGYTLDKSESKLGVIFASKDRGVDNGGQIAAAVVLTALSAALAGRSGTSYNYYNDVEKNQKIRASIIASKTADNRKMMVRVTFQRLVWTVSGKLSRIETLNEGHMIANFFEKLSKSIFLEEQKI